MIEVIYRYAYMFVIGAVSGAVRAVAGYIKAYKAGEGFDTKKLSETAVISGLTGGLVGVGAGNELAAGLSGVMFDLYYNAIKFKAQ